MDLTKLLSVLPLITPVVARAPEFIDLFNTAKALLSPEDQETAKASLEELQAMNDEDHRQRQERLSAAAKR